jgi:hypothetical protein
MTGPSTSFRLGDVITGEPHLYVPNPAAPPTDSAAETNPVPLAPGNPLKRLAAAVRRRFRLRPKPEDALAAVVGKASRS